jgi:hypothetical protein
VNAVYQVSRLKTGSPQSEHRGAQTAAQAGIACFPWAAQMETDYRPRSGAKVAYNGDALFVCMETDEREIRAERSDFGFVHTDSCLEFFLQPCPAGSAQYLNFEFNPAGGMYLSIGEGRNGRVELNDFDYRDIFSLKTAVHSAGWTLEYRIPLVFLQGFFPALTFNAGREMRGNFYKCGDSTARPHYGCWSPIDLPRPDFHCPEFFGRLVLE